MEEKVRAREDRSCTEKWQGKGHQESGEKSVKKKTGDEDDIRVEPSTGEGPELPNKRTKGKLGGEEGKRASQPSRSLKKEGKSDPCANKPTVLKGPHQHQPPTAGEGKGGGKSNHTKSTHGQSGKTTWKDGIGI